MSSPERPSRIWWITLPVLIVCSGVLIVSAAAPDDLPAGAGQPITSARCLTCHGADIIREQRLSRAAWVREVDKMIGWGATPDATEKDEIVAYLSARFGTTPPAPEPAAGADEPAAALLSRCLTCHAMPLIEKQRLSVAGWKREIDKMVGWGATLTEADVELLSKYLAGRFGPVAR